MKKDSPAELVRPEACTAEAFDWEVVHHLVGLDSAVGGTVGWVALLDTDFLKKAPTGWVDTNMAVDLGRMNWVSMDADLVRAVNFEATGQVQRRVQPHEPT